MSTLARRLNAIPGVLSMRACFDERVPAVVSARHDSVAIRAALSAILGTRPYQIVVPAMTAQQAAELDATIQATMRASERIGEATRARGLTHRGWCQTGYRFGGG